MKHLSIILLLLAGFIPAFAGEPVWHDASEFPLYGKAVDSTLTRYERLPASYQGKIRNVLWNLGRNSAGLFLRFRSDSPYIRVKWTSMTGNSMNHMAATGVRGVDLYVLMDDGQWHFAGVGRPAGRTTDAKVADGMSVEDREYMLYLPLYDGVDSLSIGIDGKASISGPEVCYPDSDGAVVMYGTSILQGGCASRPGMAHTNILGRMLGREVINLGFSGNALLDYEIAEVMASVADPAVFVLDYVPNASAEQIAGKGETFFRILRDAHPDVPVVFIEDPQFPHSCVNQKIGREISRKNAAQRKLFESLKKSGEKKIFYIPSENLIGDDGEATVDGVHFTDLGMIRYAECVFPVIRKALGSR